MFFLIMNPCSYEEHVKVKSHYNKSPQSINLKVQYILFIPSFTFCILVAKNERLSIFMIELN